MMARRTQEAHRLHADPVAEFADAGRRHGLVIESVVGDGNLHRVHVEGDRRGSRNGWYLLHLNGVPAGAFGSWRGDWRETWRARGSTALSAAEIMHMNAAIAEAKRQRDAERLRQWERAAESSQAFWQAAAAPHTAHPYLLRKGVKPHGIRQSDSLLVIPMRDADGKLWNVQTIAPDGAKLFRRGARKAGTYHAIGGAVTEVLNIAEGYATAASVHEATGQPVAVAFDCGNLEPVARALRAKYPRACIVVCADNDVNTDGNPGLTKAKAAAAAVGGLVAVPPEPFNDFNDVANAEVIP